MILSLLRVKDFAVEDMMRSSFAEFRAQREQPDVVAARTHLARKLADLQAKPWPSGPGRCAPDHLRPVDPLPHGRSERTRSV